MLLGLTRHKEPPKVPVRPSTHAATFLVGDASGAGYGTTMWSQDGQEFEAAFGGWTTDMSGASSNE